MMKQNKKSAFWIVTAFVIVCIAVVFCLLSALPTKREFAMNGYNISSIDTDTILDRIVKAERLDDSSLLCVNADNFDLMLTSDFNWDNDGAIRYFYSEKQKTYSAQLRLFNDESKYLITERTEWTEQERIFKLQHYLDALKYIPQEEVRRLSPDADGYSVGQMDYGGPTDFDLALTYSPDGVTDLNGWYIHLAIQPLHENNGAYSGTGDEVIHLFYGYN